MRELEFYKMQAAGNDYVYVDARGLDLGDISKLAIGISDRHFGVGSDGLVLILDSQVADYKMRMFNADGSEAQMCGNASRCVGKFIYENGLSTSQVISIETLAGIKILSLSIVNGIVESVSVDMGAPILDSMSIPVIAEDSSKVAIEVDGTEYLFTCISMGNPHAVTYVQNVDNFDVEGVGRVIENHPLFPERTNVEFIQVITPTKIKMRVWERGSGETLACGTGACASVVAGVINSVGANEVTVKLLGGEVVVKWSGVKESVILTGDAQWVFRGKYLIY
ncbi:MAG: diaminopimelate epimerase [Bacteroidales bacterium]